MSLVTHVLPKMLVLGSLALLACGDDEPTVSAGFLELSVSPSLATVVRGGPPATLSLTLNRGGSFSGPVTLAVSGLPAGVAGTITPTQLSGNTTTAILSITAGQTAALIAFVLGLAGMTCVKFFTPLAWPWYVLLGSLGTLTLGLLASLIFPAPQTEANTAAR